MPLNPSVSAPFRDKPRPQLLRVFILEKLENGTYSFTADQVATISSITINSDGAASDLRRITLSINGVVNAFALSMTTGSLAVAGVPGVGLVNGDVVTIMIKGLLGTAVSGSVTITGTNPTTYFLGTAQPVSGAWFGTDDISSSYVRSAGAHTRRHRGYVRVNGVWKQAF